MAFRKARLRADESLVALRRLHSRTGRPLSSADVMRADSPLYRDLLRHYGSIAHARRAAGIPTLPRNRRWSPAIVLRELRKLHRSGIRMTVTGLLDEGHLDLVAASRTYFRFFTRARAVAGIPTPRRLRGDPEPWDEQRVVDEILALYRAGEPVAFSRVPRKLRDAAKRLFGNYQSAIEAAGLDYDKIRLTRTYDDDELLDILRRMARRRPHMRLGELREQPISQTIANRFGGLERAAALAGLRNWPVRELHRLLNRRTTIAKLRARRRAGQPTYERAVARSDPRLAHAVRRHFDHWDDAIAAAKLKSDSPRRRWTRASIIATLKKRLAGGKPVHYAALRVDDVGLASSGIRHFGTWSALLEVIDGKPAHRRWTDATVLHELRRVARGGTMLRYRDVPVALYKACLKRFGSLEDGLRIASRSRPNG